jgi:hypothetical protein
LGGLGQNIRIRSEELASDRVLFRLKLEIAKVAVWFFCRLRADDPMGACEFRHEEPTPALVSDQPAKDRIGDACHGSEDGGRTDVNRPDRETGRKRTMGSVFIH